MKKNILVVDDSALMRRVICDIINSDSNVQAKDTCRDGLEAYEKLKTTSYDGVLLDVNMPRMDGLQLLERLQNENIKANVIMVSTLTTKDAEVTILALERGAIDFVTKPTAIAEARGDEFKKKVLEVMNAVLNSRTISRTSASRTSTSSSAASSMNVAKPVPRANITRLKAKSSGNKLVALACSTGGPKALHPCSPRYS